jgi:hypothetical protein
MRDYITDHRLLYLPLSALPGPGVGGHGLPVISVPCSFDIVNSSHRITEAQCISNSVNSLSVSATVSFHFFDYAQDFISLFLTKSSKKFMYNTPLYQSISTVYLFKKRRYMQNATIELNESQVA